MTLKFMTGTVLSIFIFLFLTVLMFGFFNTLKDSLVIFKSLYFLICFCILGTIFLYHRRNIKGNGLRILLFFAIVIFSLGLGSFAGAMKNNYDINHFLEQQSIEQFEAQELAYAEYTENMSNYLVSINQDKQNLAQELTDIEYKINNREPIVIENIIVIPGEKIYVEEYVDNYYDDYEDEDEEEEEEDD